MLKRNGQSLHSEHERHFCGTCGSHLWAQNPQWPKLVHPVASAIDTPLPVAPSNVHMMVDSAANWALVAIAPDEEQHSAYPDVSLSAWHQARGYGEEGES